MLIQVNAIDDIAIDRVTVNVAGLIIGDRTLVEATFPYEFLIKVPYGQAGEDLNLDNNARVLISTALQRSGGNKSLAAKMLGITRRTLYSRLKLLGMEEDGSSGP